MDKPAYKALAITRRFRYTAESVLKKRRGRALGNEETIVAKTLKVEQPGKKRKPRTVERRIPHAVNHPVRLDVLSILIERVASPNEMSEQLKVALGNVSFHVTELLRDGVIELVKTAQRRGAIEHYYRAKTRPEISDKEWAKLPKASRRQIVSLVLQAIVAESLTSLKHGKMDADDHLHLAWKVMRLDQDGCREVSELQAEMLERVESIREENEERLDSAEDGSVRIVAMMGFERGTSGTEPVGDALDMG